jgi:hypothetical protein
MQEIPSKQKMLAFRTGIGFSFNIFGGKPTIINTPSLQEYGTIPASVQEGLTASWNSVQSLIHRTAQQYGTKHFTGKE